MRGAFAIFFFFLLTLERSKVFWLFISASANCIWILKPGAILSLASQYLLKVLEIVDGTDMLLE